MKHDLKAWPVFFNPLLLGEKTFEIRKNDRGFAIDDILVISEWDPERKKEMSGFTGRQLVRRVTYVTDFPPGIREGYVVMGLGTV